MGGADTRTESGHVDTFAAENLPPRALWPVLDLSPLPYLEDVRRLNCAAELLDRNVAAGRGDQPALRFADGVWTYRQLLEIANRIAHVLRDDARLVPGNRVLLRGTNHPLLAACWFAVLKAGGVCVTTMPLLRARELSTICDRARISLAISDARLAEEIERTAGTSETLKRVLYYNAPGSESLERSARTKPAAFANVDTAADDVALIAFTSGTTGVPKGTMHFHRDVIAVCDCFPPHVLRATVDDIFCGSPPLAFTYGLGGLILFPLRIGASTLLLEDASPPNLLEGMARHGATVCFTAPTAYRAMAARAGGYDLSRLRKCVSAGETLPGTTFEQWQAATGIRIIDGIGSTELLHIFISSPEAEARAGSTGRIVHGYEACILNAEDQAVPPGNVGRLAVRGITGCRYLADEERQRAYVQNGWNLTGDAYLQDAEGYFWYQARTDDLIIASGYNIAGPEVENVLLEHPAVQECAVVGLPDEERGHVVAAFVVLRPGWVGGADTTKLLQEHVKAAIAPYKYPRRVEFVEKLPRTQTGKLQRFRLREDYM
jgi:2-aminobenzoate-CoA ligase